MPEYLPLPDGSFLTLKKGQDPKDAWVKAVEAYPEAFGVTKEEKEKPESGFIPALKAGGRGYRKCRTSCGQIGNNGPRRC